MLDEPMAGVNPALAQTIIGHVQDLRDEGLTVVFVEHDMDVVRTISDWVVVMSEGEVIAEGKHSSIVTNPRVIDAYLGAHHGTPLDRDEQDRQLAEAQMALETETVDAPTDVPSRGGGGDAMSADAATAETDSAELVLEADEVVAGYVPGSTSSRAPTCSCTTASWSASSAPTAPASRRWSRRCSASSLSAPARCGSAATT